MPPCSACTRARTPREGFSLIELSVVIAIVSVVAVMGLEVAATFMSRTAYQVTQERIEAIDRALVQYRRQYGRLPCPGALASSAVAESVKGGRCYGKEKRNDGAGNLCANYSNACDAAAFASNSNLKYGTVPVRDLGLPLYYMTDGYNNLLTYYVTNTMVTSSTSFNLDTSVDGFTIRSGKQGATCGSTGNVCQTRGTAAYVLLSFGKNARGATSPAGTVVLACLPALPGTTYVDGAIDSVNCRNGANLTLENTVPLDVFYDSRFNIGTQEQSYYDDIIKWRSKSSL